MMIDPENRRLMAVLAGVLVVVAALWMVSVHRTAPAAAAAYGSSGLAYFTVDDGQTWFADDAILTPPFKKDGRDAVRAYLVRGPDGKPLVAYLERYTATALAKMEIAAKAPHSQAVPPMSTGGIRDPIEVKKPGQATWVNATDPRAEAIRTPTYDGKPLENAQPIFP